MLEKVPSQGSKLESIEGSSGASQTTLQHNPELTIKKECDLEPTSYQDTETPGKKEKGLPKWMVYAAALVPLIASIAQCYPLVKAMILDVIGLLCILFAWMYQVLASLLP